MNEKIDIDVKTLRPFTRFIYTIGELPTSYLMSMTYEEQLIWLCNYLKETVIPTVNNNAEAVKEVQDIVMELQDYINNYFDNLDVQEEINNKLDEMVEAGTLQEIISEYLNSKAIFGFDNVSDLKSGTNLIDGSYAKTLGYYSKNDGGEGLYKIRTITNEDIIDEASIIAIGEGELIAELISKEIYVEQFGCYGDGTHDDTTNLQKAINYCITNKLLLKSKGGKTFKITASLNLNNRIDIDFNGSIITTTSAIAMLVFNYSSGEEYQGYLKNIIIDMNNISTIGIHCVRLVKKTISDIVIKNISGIAYQIDLGHEVIFENSHLYGSETLNTSIGLKLNKGDCHYKDLIMKDVHTAIWSSSTNFYTRIHAWIKTQSLLDGSIFMKCDTTSNHFLNQCYSDTYQYPFYVTNSARIKLSEHYNFNNSSIMTSEVISAFTDPYVYMFYFTDGEYSRGVTISNSKIQGYPDNTALAKFSNISQDSLLSFVDPLTYVVNWGDGNFKNNEIPITNTDITGSDFDLVTSYANKFTVTGCTVTLNIKLKANKFIASGTATKLFNIPQKYRPTSETVFIVPTSLSTYGVKNIAFIYIIDNGNVYYVVNGDTNSNDLVILNHTYITNNNQP